MGQSIVFRPKPLFLGSSSFTYRICDDRGACGTALVTVTFVLSR